MTATGMTAFATTDSSASLPIAIRVSRALALVALAAMLLSATGCAFGEFRPGDPFNRQLTLDEAQHRYTVLVRFAEFQKARSFVAEDDRDAFRAQMDSLEEVRFTGYDSETVELDDEKQSATVRVTYTLYTPYLPYEIEIDEIQEWSRDGLTNKWKVVSTFDGLEKIAAN